MYITADVTVILQKQVSSVSTRRLDILGVEISYKNF